MIKNKCHQGKGAININRGIKWCLSSKHKILLMRETKTSYGGKENIWYKK